MPGLFPALNLRVRWNEGLGSLGPELHLALSAHLCDLRLTATPLNPDSSSAQGEAVSPSLPWAVLLLSS